jgi:hypothetical protein
MIDELLNFNKTFVETKGYEKYITNKYPDKKIAIVTCMDTRLTELLPAALGIKTVMSKSSRMPEVPSLTLSVVPCEACLWQSMN